MNTKEAVETEEKTLKESSLSDLSVADEQAGATKGGDGARKQMEIKDFSFGVENPTTIGNR